MALFLFAFFAKIHDLYTTTDFASDKIKPKRRKGIAVEDKLIKILLRLAHLSEKFKTLADELDTIYDLLGDQSLIEFIREIECK